MLGVITVCSILIYKGYWYIIFALVFTLGVSYSQGMSAYNKYKLIKKVVGDRYKNPQDDPSPTRRKNRVIEERFGSWAKYLSITKAVVFSWLIFDPGAHGWFIKTLFVFSSLISYLFVYYFPVYWIALATTKKMKGGLNGKKRKTVKE